MATKQIYIDKPCSESWDSMTPNGQGRHCLKCCKTVVDFSTWETEDIISYISKSSDSVCGQVKAADVVIPQQTKYRDQVPGLLQKIMYAPVSFLRKVAAVIVLCFGFTDRQEIFAQQPQKQSPQKQGPQRPVIMGGMRVPPKTDTTTRNNDDLRIRGEIAVPPQQDTAKVCPPKQQTKGKIRVN